MRRYFVPMITAVISAAVVISCGGDGEVGALTLNLSLPEGWESRLDMSVLSAPASTPYIGTVRVKLDCAGDTRTWDLPWSDHGADFGQLDLEKGCDIQVQALTAGRIIMDRVQRNVVVPNGSDSRVDIQLEEAGGFSFAGTLTHPRQFHSAVDTGGKVLVLGGSLSTRTVEEVIYTGEGFSTAAFGCSLNEYRTMQKALYDRTGNRIFVFQGGTLDSLYEIVDVGNESCISYLLDNPRDDFFPIVFEDQIYLLGGNISSVWQTDSIMLDTLSLNESFQDNIPGIWEHTLGSLLVSGDNLICVGGEDKGVKIDIVEHYDMKSSTYLTQHSISQLKSNFAIVELSDERFVISGGIGDINPLRDVEILSPFNHQLNNIDNILNYPRYNHTATIFVDDKILIVGGGGTVNSSSSAEIFDPSTGESVELPWRMRVSRSGHTATLLPDGRVLIIGGNPGDPTMEVFNPPVE